MSPATSVRGSPCDTSQPAATPSAVCAAVTWFAFKRVFTKGPTTAWQIGYRHRRSAGFCVSDSRASWLWTSVSTMLGAVPSHRFTPRCAPATPACGRTPEPA